MRNFSRFLFGSLVLCLTAGCSEQAGFFSDIDKQGAQIQYLDGHELQLDIVELSTTIDESGFSPKLKGTIRLENLKRGPWPQAWVALHINIHLDQQPLAEFSRASVIEKHHMDIYFEQELPRFGIKKEKIAVQVRPVGWMPTFPLVINNAE